MIEYIAGTALISSGVTIAAAAAGGTPTPITWTWSAVGSAIVTGAVWLYRKSDNRGDRAQAAADRAKDQTIEQLTETNAQLRSDLERERAAGRERAAADAERHDRELTAERERADRAEARLLEFLMRGDPTPPA